MLPGQLTYAGNEPKRATVYSALQLQITLIESVIFHPELTAVMPSPVVELGNAEGAPLIALEAVADEVNVLCDDILMCCLKITGWITPDTGCSSGR